MNKTFTLPGRLVRPRGLRGRIGTPRRLLVAPLAGLLATALLLLVPALASADNSSQLTVVGTSDVSDSGLISNVVMPDFQKAYPGITFKYAPSATGTAIQSAESGNGGPSALIVHAASLENQFVANGYSYNNQYGNAIFTNSFLLAGPKSDPAGVSANAAHNVAQSFADIAAAGAAGHATFLTRGGTITASGTTVEEHAIWALVNSSGLKPASLVLCTVSGADGGGMSPISSSVQATSGQPCPDAGTVSGAHAPAWYYVNSGVPQGQNVLATNGCTVGTSGPNTCYVLTDDGTYDDLSAPATGGPNTIPNLTVVSSDNSASAPGGQNELVNYFHVYIINPSKPGEAVNLTGAQDLVTLLTGSTFQSQLKDYLPNGFGGPPFMADASPNISVTKSLPKTYRAGKKATIKGSVTNAEPGFPAPAGKPVSVDEIVAGLPVPVATGKTSSTGGYSISFVPPATGSYEVSTGQISQIENSTLNPPYGDILSPAATAAVKVTVHSAVTSLRVKSEGGRAIVLGTVSPGTRHVKATVTVSDRKGTKGRFRKVSTDKLGPNDANFAVALNVAAGKWQFKVSFTDSKAVVGSTSKTVTSTIGARPAPSVTLKSTKVKKGALTATGSVKPKAGAGQTKIELLGMRTSGTSAQFAQVGKVTVKKGKTTFTVHAKLKRGYRWILQLEQVRTGEPPSYSGLKTVNVT